jgi:MoxR-like ATPase
MAELFIASGVPVEQSVYPNLLSGDQLTDLDGTISVIRLNDGQYAAPLNGVIASATHSLLVNKNTQIDTLASPASDLLMVKMRMDGCVSMACADEKSSELVICGPAMRVRAFNPILARTLIVFLLANKHVYSGVCAELPALVDAYTSDSVDKERCLCRFADAVSFYLERILSESDSRLNKLCISTEFPPFDNYTLLDDDRLLENSLHNAGAANKFQGIILGTTVATDSKDTDNPGKYIGPLKEKLTRYIQGSKHTLISGPTATGKTLCVEEACANLNAPLITMKGAEHLEDIDMIGGFAPVKGGVEMVYGPLTRALKAGRSQYNLQLLENEKANGVFDPVEIPPAVLFIDEVNRLQSRFLNLMIAAMNISRVTREYSVEIPANGEVVTCKEGFFCIVGAMNIGQYHMVNDIDLALLRRFHSKVSVDYLDYAEELKLIKQLNPTLNPDVVTVLCKVAQDTRYQLSGLRAPVDTDTLIKWAMEIAELINSGQLLNLGLLRTTAEDIVFAVCLERSLTAAYDPSGVAILTDNITENYKNIVKGA